MPPRPLAAVVLEWIETTAALVSGLGHDGTLVNESIHNTLNYQLKELRKIVSPRNDGATPVYTAGDDATAGGTEPGLRIPGAVPSRPKRASKTREARS